MPPLIYWPLATGPLAWRSLSATGTGPWHTHPSHPISYLYLKYPQASTSFQVLPETQSHPVSASTRDHKDGTRRGRHTVFTSDSCFMFVELWTGPLQTSQLYVPSLSPEYPWIKSPHGKFRNPCIKSLVYRANENHFINVAKLCLPHKGKQKQKRLWRWATIYI